MDERAAQGLREGAGQVESKLNTEFIEWLNKWGSWILLVFALAAVAYFGYQKWEQRKLAHIGSAFAELETAQSPEALRSVAETYPSARAVPERARLRAADIYLAAVRTGLKPGSQPDPATGAAKPEDKLSRGDCDAMLAQAEALYSQVLDETAAKQNLAIHAISAAYGLAAVSESRGDFEKARQHYQQVIKLAEFGGYQDQAEVAKARIEQLPSLADLPKVYAASELPKPPAPPEPPAAPAPDAFQLTTPNFAPEPSPTTPTTPDATPPAAPETPEAPAPETPAPGTPAPGTPPAPGTSPGTPPAPAPEQPQPAPGQPAPGQP